MKRHLVAVHGAGNTRDSHSRQDIDKPDSKEERHVGDGRCGVCSGSFWTPQDFYDHLDDCILSHMPSSDLDIHLDIHHLHRIVTPIHEKQHEKQKNDPGSATPSSKDPATTSTLSEEPIPILARSDPIQLWFFNQGQPSAFFAPTADGREPPGDSELLPFAEDSGYQSFCLPGHSLDMSPFNPSDMSPLLDPFFDVSERDHLRDIITSLGQRVISFSGAHGWGVYLTRKNPAITKLLLGQCFEEFATSLSAGRTNAERVLAKLVRIAQDGLVEYVFEHAFTHGPDRWSHGSEATGHSSRKHPVLGLSSVSKREISMEQALSMTMNTFFEYEPHEVSEKLEPLWDDYASFQSLLWSVHRDLYLKIDVMEYIKARWLAQAASSTQSAHTFRVSWDGVSLMGSSESLPTRLESKVVLIGSISCAYATTCLGYSQRTWPRTGSFFLSGLQDMLDNHTARETTCRYQQLQS